ncbi:uncharacterized protein B0H18DRAFT_1000217 [Fomitopsis serialis]|uniref:uncharacterized protein n=1 Tax=Fomitopsis serialis TaxID=139415 RepID=UPI002007A786|nr:uncharacterized protein B0H18DRAFT_1000217 [Neoantrodia serialis]KAH9928697.1 hypothetical protein B0H18DRAFT_1000217 [Neoantrodia serialis]
MSDWMQQLDALDERLDALGDGDETDEEETSDGGGDGDGAVLKATLRRVCEVVRNASAQGAGNMDEIVVKAEAIINRGVGIAYGSDDSEGMFDFIPSFAHAAMRTWWRTIPAFMVLVSVQLYPGGIPAELLGPAPWRPDMQPHIKSTRLSRFRPDVSTSVTDATPLAQAIHQARCEITDDDITVPSKMLISPGQTCLAIIGAGGWKNRNPTLACYFLDKDDHMQKGRSITPGLSDLASTMAMDEERKLVFIADSHRVKSYSWVANPNASRHNKLPAVHTLDSDECSGCLAGKALVWNIDALQQHGPEHRRIGRGRFDVEDSWRFDGSIPHASIAFADPTFYPAVWHRHAPSGNMICGTNGRRDSNEYLCASIDLEHGGQTVARYLGHGGDVEVISTSEGDPNVFATAGSDGYARLFDVRQPLPVMTFNHGIDLEYCSSVVLVHPDGVPTLFTSGQQSEHIKLWDIRAKAAVYELSTGNNAVASMAWDPKRSALYAATECERMDRMGINHDYRPARIPRWADIELPDDPANGPGEDDDEDDATDEDEEDDFDRCWPRKAHHNEKYFGYAFDAGEHRLYRYAFKEDPDPTQLPAYGDAAMDGGYF